MRPALLVLALGALAPAAHAQDFLDARLVAEHSGQCLSVVGQSTADGAAVIQRPCAGTPDQTFRLQAAPDGEHFMLSPRHSGSCLDVAEAAPGDGGAVVQWTCWPGDNQRWRLDILENTPTRKVGTFRAAHSGRCLAVLNGSRDAGAAVVQWGCLADPNFRWRIEVLS